MRAKLTLFVGLLLLLVVVIFTLQNADVVSIRFLGWELELSQALLVFLVLAVGILTGWLIGSLSRRRRVRQKTRAPFDGHASSSPSPPTRPPGD